MSKTFIDFFAGIGGFRRGMELAGHKCVGFCEFDKFAVMSYKMMHTVTEEQRNYLLSLEFKARQKEIVKEEYLNGEWYSNDVRNVDAGSMPRADVWCFGFPCQDISIAGKQIGFDGKRSSLFFAVTRLIRDTREEDRPTTLFIENVKNLLSVNGGIDFLKLLIELDEIGYDAEWQLLNSKDFGVPQNRERVFIVGHLRGRSGRKIFPIGGSNEEANIKQIGNCMPTATRDNPNQGRVYDTSGIAPCLNKMDGGGREPLICTNREKNKVAIPALTPDRVEKRQKGRMFKEDGEEMFTLTAQDRHGVMIPISMTQNKYKETELANTLTASGPSRGRGNYSPVNGVMVREATKQGYAIAEEGDSINLEQPNSKTRRGRVGKGVAQTLTTSCNQATLDSMRIRKLTPRECFRLQGWTDEYFERAASVNSDSQLYKQAGNGVTVTVIKAIAERL